MIETPHIKAEDNAFGKTVLMPGDPLRAKFIAEKYLKNAKLVNNVRGIQGYTGTYKGVKISVMASGMGMPSMGIYSYELYKYFNVSNIIRVGSAGSINKEFQLKDILIGRSAVSKSNYNNLFEKMGTYELDATTPLVEKVMKLSDKCKIGTLYSADTFYGDNDIENLTNLGCDAIEMEAAALYHNAIKLGKKALAICTISDSLITGEKCTTKERQETFTDMIELALSLALEVENEI